MPYAHLFSTIAESLASLIIRGGYGALFVATVLEGIPLIGMIVPGHVAIFLAGFAARLGILDLATVLILGSLGALLGDFIGFSLGRRYGMGLIDRFRPYFFIRDSHIERARSLLDRHTGKALIIGRFSPVTRALMPFIVGTTKASASRFWVFNIIGGVSWAVSSVLIGYAFGAGFHAFAHTYGKFSLGAIIAAILIVWGYRFINERFHIFRKYELFTLALNVISLWALSETIQDAWSSASFMANFDIWVNAYMARAAPWLAHLAALVSTVGGTAVTGGLGLLIGIYLAFKKKWRSAAILLLSVVSTAGFLGIMKELFLRVRPENALQVIVNDPSFPSGHAGMAAAFFIAFAYVMAPYVKSWVKREVMFVLCVLAVIGIGVSRLVLNVHWASDVIAGWALGVFMATASILLVRYVGALLVKHID